MSNVYDSHAYQFVPYLFFTGCISQISASFGSSLRQCVPLLFLLRSSLSCKRFLQSAQFSFFLYSLIPYPYSQTHIHTHTYSPKAKKKTFRERKTKRATLNCRHFLFIQQAIRFFFLMPKIQPCLLPPTPPPPLFLLTNNSFFYPRPFCCNFPPPYLFISHPISSLTTLCSTSYPLPLPLFVTLPSIFFPFLIINAKSGYQGCVLYLLELVNKNLATPAGRPLSQRPNYSSVPHPSVTPFSKLSTLLPLQNYLSCQSLLIQQTPACRIFANHSLRVLLPPGPPCSLLLSVFILSSLRTPSLPSTVNLLGQATHP